MGTSLTHKDGNIYEGKCKDQDRYFVDVVRETKPKYYRLKTEQNKH